MEEYVKKYLEEHDITYVLHEHPAVFTVKESKDHCAHIPGLHCKNLFLRVKEKKEKEDAEETSQYFLVTLPSHKRLDLNHLRKELGVKKLTFGSPEKLKEYLNLTPGSVSPLGIINDTDMKVILIFDKEVWDADAVSFHPNINTETLELSQEAFHKLVDSFAHEEKIIALAEKE